MGSSNSDVDSSSPGGGGSRRKPPTAEEMTAIRAPGQKPAASVAEKSSSVVADQKSRVAMMIERQ